MGVTVDTSRHEDAADELQRIAADMQHIHAGLFGVRAIIPEHFLARFDQIVSERQSNSLDLPCLELHELGNDIDAEWLAVDRARNEQARQPVAAE